MDDKIAIHNAQVAVARAEGGGGRRHGSRLPACVCGRLLGDLKRETEYGDRQSSLLHDIRRGQRVAQ